MADYRMQKSPTCPHCGALVRDPWELFSETEQEVVTDCGSCDWPFTISRQVTFYYSAQQTVTP